MAGSIVTRKMSFLCSCQRAQVDDLRIHPFAGQSLGRFQGDGHHGQRDSVTGAEDTRFAHENRTLSTVA
jgi:hypothetical protein